MRSTDFTGIWRSVYHYPSSSRQGTFTGEHVVYITQKDTTVIAESVAGSRSVVRLRLNLAGNVLTGTWQERTDPHGYYKGKTYEGSLQLIANPQKSHMKGRWVGVDSRGSIQTGSWEVTRETGPGG